jgi:2-amino-4-hydroxy-6-hydroxymethyldihydropteridine diphosphokinase
MADVNHALLALGANLPFGGNLPEKTMAQAVSLLAARGLVPVRCSPMYRTPCFPAGAGPDYVNAVAQVAVPAGMDAAGCLAVLHKVEAAFGRERATRWGMRTLDIDLLALGDAVLPDAATHDQWRDLQPQAQVIAAPDCLILPHPRLQDRAFVLVPLAAVAPCWVHPVTGASVAEMLAALPQADRDAVQEIIGISLDSGVVKPPHHG